VRVYSIEEARAAKATARKAFARFAPVVGVGIAKIESGYAVKVNLAAEPPPGTRLPAVLKGVPVVVEVVGQIRAY
jgi:hypothetical protein